MFCLNVTHLYNMYIQVSRLHSSLVKWMVELLLNLTSSLVTPDESVGHRQHITTTADIRAEYSTLVEKASDFTKRLTRYVQLVSFA